MAILEGPVLIKDNSFVDSRGNVIQLRGVNLDPTVKMPVVPWETTHKPNLSYDGNVSFIGAPLRVEDVELHINRLKSLGYNTVRFLFTWEALEHQGPGIYDEEYISYTIQVLRRIREVGGMYVYLDVHQDVWSRYTGGSGAPLWTLYAAGFDPQKFEATDAAILHNDYVARNEEYQKMIWSTNYFRLATQTMFTLFFSGKMFAPKCIINGVNIQDYLQSHFIDAVMHFYKKIMESAPELFDEMILGLESLNEPSAGYLNVENLNEIPPERQLRLGTTPTSFQSFQMGSGKPALVDKYVISVFGPKKVGTVNIDPKGVSAWLTDSCYDEKYGWERGPEWKLGTCIWAQHGVWDCESNVLLKPHYFHNYQGETVNEDYFINHTFVDYFAAYRNRFRSLHPTGIMFLQPPVFQIPPRLKNTPLVDDRTVYAAHFYDGMSLMFKTWNRTYNVDTFGIMRGKYANPVLSIVFGEKNIRNCIRKQLREIKEEGEEYLGMIPTMFTEIGMPFDMDNKKAYFNGDYSSQTSALDALGYALEGSNLSFSLWCYCSTNDHQWGDQWNDEDFSIWSIDDKTQTREFLPGSSASETSFNAKSKVFESNVEVFDASTVSSQNFDQNIDGFRALKAILRPYPISISGSFIHCEFVEQSFYLKINALKGVTKIFLPTYHFSINEVTMKSSSGHFEYMGEEQVLVWHHQSGEQFLDIKRLPRSTENCGCSMQ